MKEFQVEAIRSDSWLGIKLGERYAVKVYENEFGEKIMVYTDGYIVDFNEEDFKKVSI